MEKKIEIYVTPNSKQQKIQKINDHSLEIWLKSKPERGRANKELLKLLADYFKVHQNQIQIIQGMKSKKKVIKILT